VKQTFARFYSRKAQRGCAAFSLGLFLLLQSMVVLPGLHARFHSDASNPGHECAVTLFAHGQVDSADAAPPLLKPEPAIFHSVSWTETILVSTDIHILPGRGPPALLA
jgi:hypothetical protein